MLTMFMFKRPVGTNARPQGRHPLLVRPPGIFCCAKAPGLGTHFGAKAPGCPGGMVTGQIDTCIISLHFIISVQMTISVLKILLKGREEQFSNKTTLNWGGGGGGTKPK